MKRASVIVLSALLFVSGVAACSGGGATMQADSTTTGQELMDLKKALDAGVITQKEYDKQREKILEGQ